MLIDKRMDSFPIHRAVPAGFALSKVKIRLASSQERPLWDTLMDTHHYLGFKRLAGRGLRYIVSYEDFWLGGLAERRLQVRPPRPMGGLEAKAAVPAAQYGGQQHPVFDLV